MQRAYGTAEISFKVREERTVLDRLHQSGCVKVRRPRGEPEAILINTAGGLTDGDRLDISCVWGEGTAASVATQTCERVYRSRSATASIETRLEVREGARAAWLPQETILFDGGKLARHTRVDLHGNAKLLACEAMILGRPAMGERVASGALSDFWTIRRDGTLIFADRFALNEDLSGQMDFLARGNGARAWATILLCALGLKNESEELAPVLADLETPAGVSNLGEVLLIRVLAESGYALRKSVTKILQTVPGSPALPRVWCI
ncbi:MAG: urease accessory protein UreD [Pseudomonadota bacterium]